jgi:arylsulfatase A-like enzyme
VPSDYSIKFGANPGQRFLPENVNMLEIRTLTKFGLNQDDKSSIVSLYDGAINYFDEQFSSLLFMLKRYDILDNTIIILTSDHGEEFWEHGNYEHGHSVYDEVLRVPLIIGYGHNLSPERISAKYQLVDILPIIAQLSNIEPPSNIRGIDLTKGSRDGGRVVFAEGLLFGEEKKVVIRDSFKLIRNTGKIYPDTLELYGFLNNYLSEKPKVDLELYDIKQDWKETNNLVKTLPDMTEKLNRLLDRIVLMNIGPSDLSRERVNQKLEDLKSLGYIH